MAQKQTKTTRSANEATPEATAAEQLRAIRDTGAVDMQDNGAVCDVARQMRFTDLVNKLEQFRFDSRSYRPWAEEVLGEIPPFRQADEAQEVRRLGAGEAATA